MLPFKMGYVNDVKKLGQAVVMRSFIKEDHTTAVDSNYIIQNWREYKLTCTGLNLGLHPANERCRYFVTTSLIGWVQA